MTFNNQRIHMIGIGGIGMSAIAEMLHTAGIYVQGSDIAESYVTKKLIDSGIKIKIGHNVENIDSATIIIRSTAIKDNHVEIQEALRRGLQILHRAEALAILLRGKRTIAVTGTHGKSTTTAMIGMMCVEGELDPTIVNGAIIHQVHSNALIGKSNLAVIESDESDESFLVLPAEIGVITNMDPEHLDYYGTAEAMEASYMKFIAKVPSNSFCLLCSDHPKLAKLLESNPDKKLISYGMHSDCDISASNIRLTSDGMLFDVSVDAKIPNAPQQLKDLKLGIYGRHNVQNSLAAIAIGLLFRMPLEKIYNALSKFQGIKRRFTTIGKVNGITIIDDYAHHPVEIKATLAMAREVAMMQGGRVIAVMQPHRYTRLANLIEDFGKAFVDADAIILTKVYSAHESPIPGATSEHLAECIEKNGQKVLAVCENYSSMPALVAKTVRSNDLVIMLGAGDITKWGQDLYIDLQKLQ